MGIHKKRRAQNREKKRQQLVLFGFLWWKIDFGSPQERGTPTRGQKTKRKETTRRWEKNGNNSKEKKNKNNMTNIFSPNNEKKEKKRKNE